MTGIKSLARSLINGKESEKLRHHHMAAYRAAIPVSAMKKDADIVSKVDLDSINFW